jgi:hypothetical protein
MGRTTFSEAATGVGGADFPKLKLQNGDSARIVCLEAPYEAWSHRLEAPRLLNGQVLYKDEKTRDNSTVRVMDMEFIGSPLCLGREELLAAGQLDTERCPACSEAARHPSEFRAAAPRWAMNVIRYNIRGGFNVIEPYQVSVEVWAFGKGVMRKLKAMSEELDKVGQKMHQHDLLLGPCTNVGYQKFEIAMAMTAEWMTTQQRQQVTGQVWQYRTPDETLVEAIGRKVEPRFMETDVQRVLEKWAVANGTARPGAPTDGGFGQAQTAQTVTAALNDLLPGGAAPTAPTAPVAPPAAPSGTGTLDFSMFAPPAPAAPAASAPDLVGLLPPIAATATNGAVAAQAPAPAAPAAEVGMADLAALLNQQ